MNTFNISYGKKGPNVSKYTSRDLYTYYESNVPSELTRNIYTSTDKYKYSADIHDGKNLWS